MGNGFSLTKHIDIVYSNRALDGPRFVTRQIYSLQHWKRNFDLVKESLSTVLLSVRLPKLPQELWNEKILGLIVKPVGNKVYKVDSNSEEISKGLFARVCMGVHITKLKKRINYRDGVFLNYFFRLFRQY